MEGRRERAWRRPRFWIYLGAVCYVFLPVFLPRRYELMLNRGAIHLLRFEMFVLGAGILYIAFLSCVILLRVVRWALQVRRYAASPGFHDGAVGDGESVPQWKRDLPPPLNTREWLHRVPLGPFPENSNSQTELYLLGTNHVSGRCAECAKILLGTVDPDAVFVELCPERASILESKSSFGQIRHWLWVAWTLFGRFAREVSHPGDRHHWYQLLLEVSLVQSVGAEFQAAYRYVQAKQREGHRPRLILGDQPRSRHHPDEDTNMKCRNAFMVAKLHQTLWALRPCRIVAIVGWRHLEGMLIMLAATTDKSTRGLLSRFEADMRVALREDFENGLWEVGADGSLGLVPGEPPV